jgi:hypothetical protein
MVCNSREVHTSHYTSQCARQPQVRTVLCHLQTELQGGLQPSVHIHAERQPGHLSAGFVLLCPTCVHGVQPDERQARREAHGAWERLKGDYDADKEDGHITRDAEAGVAPH